LETCFFYNETIKEQEDKVMKRKQLKRLAALGLALTLGASGLTGCSGTDKKESAEKDGKIQLRYATGDAGPAVEVQEEIVKAFNESQDKIEVKLETYGTAFDQKLAAAIGSKKAPDIVKMWNFPAYYESLVPLQDQIDKMEDKDDFYETLFNYADMNGNIYGMPIGFSTRAFYYNKDLADNAGITVKDEWTTDDLKEMAKAATSGDATGLYFYYNPDPYAFESMLWSNGGAWLDDSGKPVINSDANKETIQYFHDMIYKDKTAYTSNRR
jgi:multiple sugar transport system substrate-binding protein